MTDTPAEPTIDSVLDAAMNAGEKLVTLPTALLLSLYQDAAEGVLLGQAVVDNWSGGGLAEAVNALEGWVDAMAADYDDMDPTPSDEEEDDAETGE